MGAALLGDGYASHRAAARLWGLVETDVIEVITSRQPRDPSVVWHRMEPARNETTTLDGIPCTSIHRTLLDLGDVVTKDVVEDALDRALEKRLTSADWLLSMIDANGTRGRKGASVLRSTLEGGHEKASWLERRLVRLLDGSSLPRYFREHGIGPYFVDFAWPEVKLAVEVHGAKWHRNRKRWTKDLTRHNVLTPLGWTVLHLTWDDIAGGAGRVVAEIAATYERLTLRLGDNAR